MLHSNDTPKMTTVQLKPQNEMTSVARQSVSAEVTLYAERLAVRAQELAERVNGTLYPVMTSAVPHPCEGTNERTLQEYPPLFADLRNTFQAIAGALDSIESAISRTEL